MANNEPDRPEDDGAASTESWNWGLGIALGVALGVGLGVALGNVGIGIALGVGFFPVFAMLLRTKPGRGPDGGSPPPDGGAPPPAPDDGAPHDDAPHDNKG